MNSRNERQRIGEVNNARRKTNTALGKEPVMSQDVLPKLSAQYITNKAEHVSINEDGVNKLCEDLLGMFSQGKYGLETWKTHELNPKSFDDKAISWIFFIDTINFSFWPDENHAKFTVIYNGKTYTGYWSICAAVNRAIEMGINVFDANYMANMTIEQFNSIFYSENHESLPLVNERVNVIREAGSVLLNKFQGNFINCVCQAENSAQKLIQIIVDNFSSYRDVSFYKGKSVCIYKRAQILIADIWCCFGGNDFGKFYDIDSLTAFADYRVPQVLNFFNAIQYSKDLKEHLDNNKPIEHDHPWEVEIRGVTLQCIEQVLYLDPRCLFIPRHTKILPKFDWRFYVDVMIMVDKINKMIDSNVAVVNSILVDNYLWDYRRTQEKSIDKVPMHRTRTIYY